MISEPITGELPAAALHELELREWREDEVEVFAGLLDTHHYLGCPDPRRRHLCQVACYRGRAVALVIWTTASAKLAGREAYVGWDARTRQKRLGWLVQNNRFLLLPSKRPSNLASRVLGLAVGGVNSGNEPCQIRLSRQRETGSHVIETPNERRNKPIRGTASPPPEASTSPASLWASPRTSGRS